MSLIVIVPQHVSQMLAEVERKLTKETFTAVMKKLMDSPFKSTVVSLPKLKLDSSHNLMDILGEMGKDGGSRGWAGGTRGGRGRGKRAHSPSGQEGTSEQGCWL